MLAAAEELFRTKGYSATGMEEIAARAEVGVATVYKYFGAKGGIVRELWRPKIEEFRRGGEEVIADPPGNAGEAIVALIDRYRFGDDWQHRDLLRALMTDLEAGYAEILQGLRNELDRQMVSHIKLLLAKLERQGKIRRGLDHDDIAAIVYGVHAHHFQRYVFDTKMTLAQVRKDLYRRLALLFEPWTPGSEGASRTARPRGREAARAR